MTTLREELEAILKMKKTGGGFHYAQRAQHLGQRAQKARQWFRLLKVPIWQWQETLSETRYVIDQLYDLGITWPK